MLLNHVEHEAAMLLQAARINQRTKCAHSAALFANHLAHVRLSDADLYSGGSFAFDFTHLDAGWVVNQRLDHHFNCFAHDSSKVRSPSPRLFPPPPGSWPPA